MVEDPFENDHRKISILPWMFCQMPLSNQYLPDSSLQYPRKTGFFGHYWLKGEPSLYRNNICCLDYSVAKKGKLVAYRLDDEKKLANGKLVWV
ncbi:MAG: hypothetical protein IPP71_08340 [Bacteroidetes bacterium]|nr:hypothetical protein [Bacteroidota bacterium]